MYKIPTDAGLLSTNLDTAFQNCAETKMGIEMELNGELDLELN